MLMLMFKTASLEVLAYFLYGRFHMHIREKNTFFNARLPLFSSSFVNSNTFVKGFC